MSINETDQKQRDFSEFWRVSGIFSEAIKENANKQFEYARWVLSSLLAVSGGSIFLISQTKEHMQQLYAFCGFWLIFSICLTIISGMFAYLNFMFLTMKASREFSKFKIVFEKGELNLNSSLWDKFYIAAIWVTLIVSFIAAIISICCILKAGIQSFEALAIKTPLDFLKFGAK